MSTKNNIIKIKIILEKFYVFVSLSLSYLIFKTTDKVYMLKLDNETYNLRQLVIKNEDFLA